MRFCRVHCLSVTVQQGEKLSLRFRSQLTAPAVWFRSCLQLSSSCFLIRAVLTPSHGLLHCLFRFACYCSGRQRFSVRSVFVWTFFRCLLVSGAVRPLCVFFLWFFASGAWASLVPRLHFAWLVFRPCLCMALACPSGLRAISGSLCWALRLPFAFSVYFGLAFHEAQVPPACDDCRASLDACARLWLCGWLHRGHHLSVPHWLSAGAPSRSFLFWTCCPVISSFSIYHFGAGALLH